ncbi:class I SAM-dependent methyltransferase [Candidatus Riflebacteria bacterium]
MAEQNCYTLPDYTRFYDWSYGNFTHDIPFYLEFLKHCGTSVLEVTCGTGRLSIPLLENGFEVTGIDSSPHMLEILKNKIASLATPAKDRFFLYEADMRDFDLKKEFHSVIVPNAALFHLFKSCDVSSCFSSIFAHTRNGGMVIVDLVSPHFMVGQETGKEVVICKGLNQFSGLITAELNEKLLIDKGKQMVKVRHTFIEQADDGEKRFEFHQNYRWLEKEEGLRLLKEEGFKDLKIFGDYDSSEFTPASRRLIFVGRK